MCACQSKGHYTLIQIALCVCSVVLRNIPVLLGLWDPVEFLGEQQCFAVVLKVSYRDLLFGSVCVFLLETDDETLTNALTSALYCVP